MTAASTVVLATPAAMASYGHAGKLAGIAVAALFPALFWTGLALGIGSLMGVTIAASTLIVSGSSIALFLGAVCAPIMLRA
jgi:hypothetical protein